MVLISISSFRDGCGAELQSVIPTSAETGRVLSRPAEPGPVRELGRETAAWGRIHFSGWRILRVEVWRGVWGEGLVSPLKAFMIISLQTLEKWTETNKRSNTRRAGDSKEN